MMDEVAGDEKQGEIVFPGSDESEKGNGPPSGLNPILKNGPEDGCIAEPTELSKDLSSNNKEVICNALEDKLENSEIQAEKLFPSTHHGTDILLSQVSVPETSVSEGPVSEAPVSTIPSSVNNSKSQLDFRDENTDLVLVTNTDAEQVDLYQNTIESNGQTNLVHLVPVHRETSDTESQNELDKDTDSELQNEIDKQLPDPELLNNGLSLAELEKQNSELISQAEDQKKVIEMLRVELTRKDDDLLMTETELRKTKEKTEKEMKKVLEDSTRKFQELKKAYEQANREKESMVIKYAMGEKDILIAKRGKEAAEKKLSDALKDKEGFQYKIKTLGNERTRLQALCDTRAQETIAAKKEGERWKEEVKQMESKISAVNSKLKSEADAHRDTKDSLDRTLIQLAELQGSIDKVKSDSQEVINKYKQDEMKTKRLEKEQEVKLMIDSVAAQELDQLRRKHKLLIEENNELSIKVQAAEKERLGYESSISEMKVTLENQKMEIVDLYAKSAELESVKIQLDREMEKCAAKDGEVTRLRADAVELYADMAACRRKESELLEFTQKLTDKNVTLQSEFSNTELRANSLEEEHSRLVNLLAKAETRLSDLESDLKLQISNLTSENSRLQAELSERLSESELAVQQAVDARNEVNVMRRQHTARIRELTKELNGAKKRTDPQDPERSSSPNLSPISRSSSSTSLHKPDIQDSSLGLLKPVSPSYSANPVSPTISMHSNSSYDDRRFDQDRLTVRESGVGMKRWNSDVNRNHQVEGPVPDTQMLVEKIVKLQRSCARRQEKLEFLEEHVEQLVLEVRKKNKIIQHYIHNIEPGALVSEQSDIHKAVISQQGGIMSSIYGSKVTDSGLTFELCLEMNKKLQAVLEDTLLKNITLKENMNTLGTEIAKISMEQQSKINK